ncbi:MAG: endonuclease V [Nitrososphaerota archaeon]
MVRDPLYKFFADVQRVLARSVELSHLHLTDGIRVCAIDASYSENRVRVGAVLWELPSMTALEEIRFSGTTHFPYIPGLFYLREGPFAAEAFRRLSVRPDLLLLEGHGVAHPRRAGLASIVGLVTGTPAVGIAKRLLCGTVVWGEGGRGWVELKGERVGVAYRVGTRVYYLSPGHMTDLETLLELLDLTGGRPHELVRRAHELSRS